MKVTKARCIAIANPNQDRYIDLMSPRVMYQGVNNLNASLLDQARESQENPSQARKAQATESQENPSQAKASRSNVSPLVANNFSF